MPSSLWSDPGTWIALGVSALFLVAAWVMHRVFLKVLKAPDPDPVPLSTAAASDAQVRTTAQAGSANEARASHPIHSPRPKPTHE